mgnify:FL=1
MRKNKTVTIAATYNCCHLPKSAVKFIAFFQDKFELVPLEFKDSITINVEPLEGMYGDGAELSVGIIYERPETNIEMEDRKFIERKFIDSTRAGKLEAYNKLKLELEL